mgnify:CR=1 FL=1
MVAGAANDNAVKTAFVMAVTVLNWPLLGLSPVVLANIAALSFILPFVLLAGPAAYWAQSLPPKQWLWRLKALEVILAALAMIAIYTALGWLLLLCVIGFGVQSALIGPLKYALIPRLGTSESLIHDNAWMESGTFVAILIGTLYGADWMVDRPERLLLLVGALALLGVFAIRLLPELAANPEAEAYRLSDLVHRQRKDRTSMSAIWCISGFWAIGSVWLTHLPLLATEIWGVSASSVGTLLSQFVAGIAAGALAGVVLRGLPRTTRVIAGALGLVAGALLSQSASFEVGQVGLFVTAMGGGFLALPLYTLLQDDVLSVAERVAVNNVANALMIVAAAVASILMVGLLAMPLLWWLLLLAILQLLLCLYHRRNLSLR